MDRAAAAIKLELKMSTAESILTRNDCGGVHSGIGSYLTLLTCVLQSAGSAVAFGTLVAAALAWDLAAHPSQGQCSTRLQHFCQADLLRSSRAQRTLMCRENTRPLTIKHVF